MSTPSRLLPVCRAAELQPRHTEERWLVEHLWMRQAVGVIGGRPKSFKSWLGLDLALSVASATPCLGRFAVDDPGAALIYLAEDALDAVRERLDSLCRHRGLDLERVELFVITTSSLRLDRDADQRRLAATVANYRPKLLLLDPLVRLHRLDENSSGDISSLLGFLRDLERRHDVAVALVHHMSKRHRADLGQALRGSSDLHAWTDTSLYLTRRAGRQSLMLTVEHRSAAALDPIEVALKTDDECALHLAIVDGAEHDCCEPATLTSLPERIVAALAGASGPLTRNALRRMLGINNQRLGDTLAELLRAGRVARTAAGWMLPTSCAPTPPHNAAERRSTSTRTAAPA